MPAARPGVSVVIPTYNEAANIGALLEALEASLAGFDAEYVVVDDDSKDGTAALARKASPRARVIVRTQERGLATAVVRGLKEATKEYVVVMDADFQHPPETVRRLVERAASTRADLVVGSRYARGGSEGNFGPLRRTISRGARGISKLLLPPIRRFHLTDPMSGLFLVRRDRVAGVELRPSGYKILLEILGRCELRRVEEVGYTFQDRRGGASKLGPGVMMAFLAHVLALSWKHPDNQRLLRFMMVGASGFVVTESLLFILHEWVGLEVSFAVLIAVEVAILNNFLLNDRFTFRDRHDLPFLLRLLMFNVVSLGGLVTNFFLFFALHYFAGLHYLLAEAIAILLAFGVNYIGNVRLTYGGTRRPNPRKWIPILVLAVVASGFYFTALDEPRGVYFDESYYLAVAQQMESGQWTDPCWAFDDKTPDMPLNYEHPPLAKLILFASIHAYDDYHGVFAGCRMPDNDEPRKRPAVCYTDPQGETTATYHDEGLVPGDRFDTGPNCFDAWIHDMKTYGNPYAWRGPSALFGVITVVFGALAARRIFRSDLAGTLAGGLILADTLVLSTSRIALLDIFAVGFAVMAAWAATHPTRKGVLGTFLFLGLGFSCKYYVLFVGPPIALLSMWMHWRAGKLTKRRFDLHWVSALLIPPLVWLATYIPWWVVVAKAKGLQEAAVQFFKVQYHAFIWDTGIGAKDANQGHQFQSEPWEWLIMRTPMGYIWTNPTDANTVGSYVYAVGNPILWLGAALGIVYVLIDYVSDYAASLRRHLSSPMSFFASMPRIRQALLVGALLPLFAYGGFFLLQRTTYIFYMVLVVPFFAILLAGLLTYLWSMPGRIPKAAVVGVLALVGAGFLLYLQVSTYTPIPRNGFAWLPFPGTEIYYPALGFNDVMRLWPFMRPYGSKECWSDSYSALDCP